MAVGQLPGRVREFANYLNGLLARLDQGGGWCGVFWQRDPDGMRACLDGAEIPPWDVVEALLQDLAAEHGQALAATEAERARVLHADALLAHDARPGGRDALGDRFDVMLREQRYAAERQAELGRLLASAATREEADALRLDLAWARDDHERATRRCAELRSRMAELDRRATGGPVREMPRSRTDVRAGRPFRIDGGYQPAAEGRADGGDPGAGGAFGARPDAGGFQGARADSDTSEAFGARPGADGFRGAGTAPDARDSFGTRSDVESFRGGHTDPDQDGAFGARPDAERAHGTRAHPGDSFGAGTEEPGVFGTSSGQGRWETGGSHEGSGAYGPASRGAAQDGGFPVMPQQRAARPEADAEYTPQAPDRHHLAPGPDTRAPEGPLRDEYAPRAPASHDDRPAPAPQPQDNALGTHRSASTAQPEEDPAYGRYTAAPQAPTPTPHQAPPTAPPPEAPAPTAKQRKRRRGGARFAGMVEEEAAPVVVPPTAVPELPTAPAVSGRRLRGARFAGAAEAGREAAGTPEPAPEPLDAEARRETVRTVERLVRLRREGRSGEAHELLAEIAHWPAARYPLLAVELHRAGLGADWATLLWEAGSLPADGLVAAADALREAGRGPDGEQILRQGVARPAVEIGRAVLAMTGDGRHREARALLDAYVRVRTPEEAARSAEPDPRTLVPLLVAAARGVSDERHWDLVHALRVAGHSA
ncbi:hypothetical protein [Streptomyces sp. NPDC001658]